MSVTLEQVEKLREKADISYEEARQILAACDGDLLEALIRLERQGRIRAGAGRSAFYTTRPGASPQPSAPLAQAEPPHAQQRHSFGAQFKDILQAAADLLRHCTVNQFEVWRGGELMTSLPVLIFILLVLVAFWISVPLLIVGLFFGCKYRFSGLDLEDNPIGQTVNRVSDRVHDAVNQAKREFQQEWDHSRRRKDK